MLAHEVAARIETAEREFGESYLSILREADRAGFRKSLGDAGLRFWNGAITWEEYKAVRAELQRDVRGTAAQYGEARRSMIGSAPRIVTMPRRKVSA